ncbi:MAG: hypothetical protein AB7K24_01540 [Gemmataceae bacterium]
MKRHSFAPGFVALTGLLALIGCGGGDAEEQARKEAEQNKEHTIRIKRFADLGYSVDVQYSVTDKRAVEKTNASGDLLSRKTATRGVEETWIETVVEEGQPAPPKFKRKYTKAQYEEEGKKYQRTYLGRTLLYLLDEEGKRYSVTPLFGALADESDLPFAYAAADPPDYFTPPRPVRIGDSWPVDPGLKLAENANLNRDKSTGEARLTRVYERDGKTFGVIEVKLKMVYPTTTSELDLTYDGVIDGTSTWSTITSVSHTVNETKNEDGTFNLNIYDMTSATARFNEKAPKERQPEPAPTKDKMKDKDKEKMKDKDAMKDKDKDKDAMKDKDKDKDAMKDKDKTKDKDAMKDKDKDKDKDAKKE